MKKLNCAIATLALVMCTFVPARAEYLELNEIESKFPVLLILIGFVSSRHPDAIANNGNTSDSYGEID